MLREGRLPLSEAEHAAVDKLIAKNPDEPLTLTRRDPGETGPLLVHASDTTYLVDETGRTRKQSARKAAD